MTAEESLAERIERAAQGAASGVTRSTWGRTQAWWLEDNLLCALWTPDGTPEAEPSLTFPIDAAPVLDRLAVDTDEVDLSGAHRVSDRSLARIFAHLVEARGSRRAAERRLALLGPGRTEVGRLELARVLEVTEVTAEGLFEGPVLALSNERLAVPCDKPLGVGTDLRLRIAADREGLEVHGRAVVVAVEKGGARRGRAELVLTSVDPLHEADLAMLSSFAAGRTPLFLQDGRPVELLCETAAHRSVAWGSVFVDHWFGPPTEADLAVLADALERWRTSLSPEVQHSVIHIVEPGAGRNLSGAFRQAAIRMQRANRDRVACGALLHLGTSAAGRVVAKAVLGAMALTNRLPYPQRTYFDAASAAAFLVEHAGQPALREPALRAVIEGIVQRAPPASVAEAGA